MLKIGRRFAAPARRARRCLTTLPTYFPKSGPAADVAPDADPVYEAFTDPAWLEAATEVMGSIDTDPFSTAEANERVRARTFYTKQDNGLEQPWRGNVWCNAPWGDVANAHLRELYSGEDFLLAAARKLVAEIERGHVEQAIVVFPDKEGDGVSPLRAVAWDLVAHLPRVGALRDARFMRPGGDFWIYPRGIHFFYYGARASLFQSRFATLMGPSGPE